MVITTKSQKNTRNPSPEEQSHAEGSQAPAASGPWTVDEKGVYSGPGKHYGDTQPKVAVSSFAEAAQVLKEVDPSARTPKEPKANFSVKSDLDTLDTQVVEISSGVIIISGPLATLVSQARGALLLTAGDGNPSVDPGAPVDEPKQEKNE
jgi:hypothetical protein